MGYLGNTQKFSLVPLSPHLMKTLRLREGKQLSKILVTPLGTPRPALPSQVGAHSPPGPPTLLPDVPSPLVLLRSVG